MAFDHGLFVQVGAMMIGAGAVYGGIRNDLRNMHEQIARLERALEKAHERIDSISGHGRRHGDEAGN